MADLIAEGFEVEARELLSFFEKIAFLCKRKVVDKTVAWHFFGSWILPYYQASRALVQRLQSEDKNVFRDFDQLYESVHRIEERERHYQDAGVFSTDDYQRRFLERESKLNSA